MSCFLCHLVLGAAHGGLLFVVCGFWGLFCFGLPGSFLWGLGGAMWSGFLGCVLTVALAWLHALLCGVGWGFVGFVWRV